MFLRAYIDSLATSNVGNNHRNCLASADRYGIQYHREIETNPMLPIKSESRTKREQYISDDVYYALLTIVSQRNYAFLELL